jgi:thiol-disulfide isomerase/thioredoxin
MKATFKTGFIFGSIIGIILIIFGYITFQNMANKADNISNMDLHQLQYQDLNGNKVELSGFEGKHLLINFWATWCAPCIKEFPILNETYDLVKEDFVFVMVSYESKEKIKNFIKDKPYKFIFLKSNNFLLEGITTLPQSFILDEKGKNIYHHPTNFEGDKKQIQEKLYKWIEN